MLGFGFVCFMTELMWLTGIHHDINQESAHNLALHIRKKVIFLFGQQSWTAVAGCCTYLQDGKWQKKKGFLSSNILIVVGWLMHFDD